MWERPSFYTSACEKMTVPLLFGLGERRTPQFCRPYDLQPREAALEDRPAACGYARIRLTRASRAPVVAREPRLTSQCGRRVCGCRKRYRHM
jgi:hypothetical protein